MQKISNLEQEETPLTNPPIPKSTTSLPWVSSFSRMVQFLPKICQHWHIIITQSTQCILEFTLDVVRPMGLDKSIMMCIHCYNIPRVFSVCSSPTTAQSTWSFLLAHSLACWLFSYNHDRLSMLIFFLGGGTKMIVCGFFCLFLNWSIVDLQCHVSFRW